VDIDDGADIGCNCIIGTDSRVHIGQDVLVAAYAYLVAGGNHNIDDPEVPIIRQGVTRRGGITIGNGAWLGTRVTILDGCDVGEGTVVGSHALVTRSLPARVIAHGTPATVVRER
jgi:acetyltransferase-like isoleucine patch superfamily enzyme